MSLNGITKGSLEYNLGLSQPVGGVLCRRTREGRTQKLGLITYLVAMPEQRARVLRATRSPRSSLRTGPRTVAHWVIGLIEEPSSMCHSTLEKNDRLRERALQEGKV